MKRRITIYENGDHVVCDGRIEITYHKTKVIQEIDLEDATDDEVLELKKNPHNNELLQSIGKRKEKSVE